MVTLRSSRIEREHYVMMSPDGNGTLDQCELNVALCSLGVHEWWCSEAGIDVIFEHLATSTHLWAHRLSGARPSLRGVDPCLTTSETGGVSLESLVVEVRDGRLDSRVGRRWEGGARGGLHGTRARPRRGPVPRISQDSLSARRAQGRYSIYSSVGLYCNIQGYALHLPWRAADPR